MCSQLVFGCDCMHVCTGSVLYIDVCMFTSISPSPCSFLALSPFFLSCSVLLKLSFLLPLISGLFYQLGLNDRRVFDINLQSAPGSWELCGRRDEERERNTRGVRWKNWDKEKLFIHRLMPHVTPQSFPLCTPHTDSHTLLGAEEDRHKQVHWQMCM